jgi:hypothetical protein
MPQRTTNFRLRHVGTFFEVMAVCIVRYACATELVWHRTCKTLSFDKTYRRGKKGKHHE